MGLKKPTARFELATARLRIECSTTEPRRPAACAVGSLIISVEIETRIASGASSLRRCQVGHWISAAMVALSHGLTPRPLIEAAA